MKLLHTKKFRHGSLSLALTVVIIAAVILINAIFTALTEKYLWYIDMTPEPRFTLSDEAKGFLDQMNTDKEVRIILCDERYAWEADSLMLEVFKTAKDIEGHCKNVKVEYVDIYTNPSAVNPYLEKSGKAITSQSVIVVCGDSSRVYDLENFFTVDQDGYVIGYNGEQTMVSGILSVSQVSAPVACLVTNHGEKYSDSFATLLAQIGFDVQLIDLSAKPLPENCRLLVICDPQRDFEEKNSLTEVTEISKIENFLSENKSMMVLFDKDTPKLHNLEQFLAEWGIEISRTDDGEDTATWIQDLKSSLTVNGYTNKAEYAPGENTGTAITKPLRQSSSWPTVCFPNTTALRFASDFSQKTYEDFTAARNKSGNTNVYNVFVSSKTAKAFANGEEVGEASDDNRYSYMMLSCRSTPNSVTGSVAHAFILATASTDFVSDLALGDQYGNHSVLAYACNTMGSLVVPVTLDCKYYASMEITSITASAANQYTIILTVVPASIVFIAGIYVMIRRKHA
ncbi:MAG: GldG family protein [Clostridia bacterium]|nr:GldG family protein [Clostridia bacterium]